MRRPKGISSLKAPSEGGSSPGSSRRHSIDTNCHPAAARCCIRDGLNGPEITSRIRSKCAMGSLASDQSMFLVHAQKQLTYQASFQPGRLNRLAISHLPRSKDLKPGGKCAKS